MTLPQPMLFFSAAANFAGGNDTPRAFLERCLSHVATTELGARFRQIAITEGVPAAVRWRSAQFKE